MDGGVPGSVLNWAEMIAERQLVSRIAVRLIAVAFLVSNIDLCLDMMIF